MSLGNTYNDLRMRVIFLKKYKRNTEFRNVIFSYMRKKKTESSFCCYMVQSTLKHLDIFKLYIVIIDLFLDF